MIVGRRLALVDGAGRLPAGPRRQPGDAAGHLVRRQLLPAEPGPLIFGTLPKAADVSPASRRVDGARRSDGRQARPRHDRRDGWCCSSASRRSSSHSDRRPDARRRPRTSRWRGCSASRANRVIAIAFAHQRPARRRGGDLARRPDRQRRRRRWASRRCSSASSRRSSAASAASPAPSSAATCSAASTVVLQVMLPVGAPPLPRRLRVRRSCSPCSSSARTACSAPRAQRV